MRTVFHFPYSNPPKAPNSQTFFIFQHFLSIQTVRLFINPLWQPIKCITSNKVKITYIDLFSSFFHITNFLDNQAENYILLIEPALIILIVEVIHSFPILQPTKTPQFSKFVFSLFSYTFSASKQKHYREFDHFGNLLEQTRGYAVKVLAGVTVNRNSKLGEPPNAFEFVVDRS